MHAYGVDSKCPGSPAALTMNDVRISHGFQPIPEIGAVTRFVHKGAITVFAGVDSRVINPKFMNKKVFTLLNMFRQNLEKAFF